MLSKLREPVNGLMHLGGAVAAVFGQIALLAVASSGIEKVVSAIVYGVSLVALFSASAAYHLIRARPKTVEILRKIDHSAIYLLIAGTYTPICMNAFSGFYRWGLLAIVWSIAFAGILVKVFFVEEPRWVAVTVYVIMGWLSVSAIGQMLTALSPATLAWLIVGGVVYTLGGVVYATKIFDFAPGKFGTHEVWHVFVLVGAAAHFMAVLGVFARVG
ncbi:MAG: hemolysin III family protein [Anaerolineales bacterium]